jgi:hypothetical protein
LKFLSRIVTIEARGPAREYALIAGAMGLALLALMPVLASSFACILGE